MESLYLIPSMPGLSIAIWVAISMVFFYFARVPMHKAIEGLMTGTAGGLRKTALWAKSVAEAMREKDRKVLLESGVASAQEKIMQEFRSVEAGYAKHLSDYPKLQLKLDDNITHIEADYKECGQVTPEAPGWSEVVETIARAQTSNGDRIIEKMLGEIHKSAVAGEKKALSEFRDTAAKRHKILASMAPVWRRLEKLSHDINKKVGSVLETSGRIDKYMTQFEKIAAGGPESIDMLSSKMTKLFIFSLFVLGVAFFGAIINFQLIALPMSELVPAGTRIGGMMVSEISAMVIVTLEIVLGIFLMESLGITNIFPQIAGMMRSKRKILLYAALFGLLFLASVEASLAILREALAEADAALDRSLAGETAGVILNETSSRITVIGQATLGFVLPWILAMVAVPLEMFIEASQHAFTRIFILIMNLLGHISDALAYIIEALFNLLSHLFDAYIIIPTQVANLIENMQART
ncbi:MAG: hypothetical protein GWO08_04770 [Gammaproteobacteria bacterium]|nr:hypothetical protein [Gammaproteobacteria bacterium]NIN62602.1 hypothetical protein [Gammaproteobacteria bacterium]NIO63146.1 hypothetical protein [Gammaproteobacteria bacterium]NIP48982.1 hypothetical protein [Gammaproteobacteria bacterium]NIQ09437.1 hypothetical protein [Gammaproteobacteria bacterium]